MKIAETEKPTVLIDMDGVIADFDFKLVALIEKRHPNINLKDIRTNFSLAADYPEHSDVMKAISDEAEFFESLPIVDGALAGWQRIIDYGYSPRICSSPISTNPHSKAEKLAWLEEHLAPVFGCLVVDQAIITKYKSECVGIALIDDRPEIENSNSAVWQYIIFDRPYNRKSPKPRLLNWGDQGLLQLLKSAEIRYLKA